MCDTGVDFWWPDLKEFMAKRKDASDWRGAIRDGSFATYLSDFLVHRDGGENKDKFTFERELVCGEPASGIKVSVPGKFKVAQILFIHSCLDMRDETHIASKYVGCIVLIRGCKNSLAWKGALV